MKKIKLLLIIFLLFAPKNAGFSMQTLYNVPSADIAEKGHFVIQEEAQFRPYSPNPYYFGTTYTGFGIGHNTELDVNLYNYSAPASNNITIGAGFKSAIPIKHSKKSFKEQEVKLVVGTNVLFGLEGNGYGNWSYALLSTRVPKLKTRIGAGLSYGSKQLYGTNTVAFVTTVEQPITQKTSALLEWTSGTNNSLGYLVTGFCTKINKTTDLYYGYQTSNNEEVVGSGFIVQVAKRF